jgi:uncharacterized protein YndB with AHSA1/START domain
MTAIVETIEIARSADDVFAYVTDPTRFAEWQKNVVGGHMERNGGKVEAGQKCLTTRRIGRAEREITSEITEVTPPRTWAVRGIDGPIRSVVNVTVKSLNGRESSQVTISLDFEGHGIGRLLVPLFVRREARSEMPENMRKLKDRLELPSGERQSSRSQRQLR